MPELASECLIIPTPRLRALVVPREHGAWGMLLVPLATGAAVGLMRGGQALLLLVLLLASVAVFWLRTPLESWLGTTPLHAQTGAERRAVLAFIVSLSSVAALMFTLLFWDWQNRALFPMGAVVALAFIAQATLKKLSRRLRMAAQVVGAIGLTATAPAAYIVSTGRFDSVAAALWGANWLFAGDQIHFVQLRIHAARVEGTAEKLRRGRVFLAGQIGLALVLIITAKSRVLPWLALLAFAPALFRGIAWFLRSGQPLAVRRLGWSELAHAVAFGMLLVAHLPSRELGALSSWPKIPSMPEPRRVNHAETLRKVPIFSGLEEHELQFLAQRAVPRQYSAGKIIFSEGDPCTGLYVVEAGNVRIFKSSASGREQVLAIEGAGSSIAELPVFDGGNYPASTSAVSDSTLLFVSKNDFQALCLEHPRVALKVLRVVGARLRRLVGIIEELSFTTVHQRLSAFLCRLADAGQRTSAGVEITLPSSNQELAAQIGTVRELVSRNLSRLQAQGLIQMDGRQVVIPNLQKLQAEAEIGE